ncbi:MAG: arginine--tRNA ligase, partial [Leptospiraceae bacterium]|nr:arginine--tRNA ligase [Leptospiraceae bacterium]
MTNTLFSKNTIKKALSIIVSETAKDCFADLEADFQARIDYTPEFKLGQYASPAAMELAKFLKKPPREIAQTICEAIKGSKYAEYFESVEIAGPGFLNLKLSVQVLQFLTSPDFSVQVYLDSIFTLKNEPRILFEFVSANPTGPLNIVSARAAVTGDAICRILKRGGLNVQKEYYVNDFGNQVSNLGLSFAYRVLQKNGWEIALPENCYQGEYILQVLNSLLESETPDFIQNLDINSLKSNGEELEKFLFKASEYFSVRAVDFLLETQQQDLFDFRVEFDRFFRESTLHEDEKVQQMAIKLAETGKVYEKDGATYFASTEYNDDKDRVIVRSDGRPTYLLADIAYHYDKIKRGFQKIIDIWGPDHHGYIARLRGALQALNFPEADNTSQEFSVLIVQQVNLIEDGKPIVMSKRLGQFQTMKDLIEKIPVDASRYFFITRAMSTHLDFDLELALTQSSKNPVYYIQYAFARINSIFRESSRDADGYAVFSQDSMQYLNQNLRA